MQNFFNSLACPEHTLYSHTYVDTYRSYWRGTVIGFHLCHKSIFEISILSWSTVSAIIVKRNLESRIASRSNCATLKQSRAKQGNCVWCVEHKNHLSFVTSLTTEFQTASGSNISTRTVHQEFSEMGNCTQAKITV